MLNNRLEMHEYEKYGPNTWPAALLKKTITNCAQLTRSSASALLNKLQRFRALIILVGNAFYARARRYKDEVTNESKFAFVVHIYYPSGVRPALRFLRRLNFPVFFTSSNNEVIQNLRLAGESVVEVANRGRNFGGLFSKEVISRLDADFIGHLHWKKSGHNPFFGYIWNMILWTSLTNPRKLSTIEQKAESSARFVAFVDMKKVFSPESQGWGRSKKHLALLDDETYRSFKSMGTFDYPMGGMFICSKPLYLELIDLWGNLSPENIEEPIPLDGSVVHFFERCVGALNVSKGGIYIYL